MSSQRRTDNAASKWTAGEPSSVLIGPVSETRMRERLTFRVVPIIGLAAIALIFPVVGEHRFIVAWLLVGLSPTPIVLVRLVKPQHWMLSQTIFDVGVSVCLIGFLPDVWVAGLIIVVASPTAASALLGRRQYVGLEAGGLVGLGVVAHFSGAQNWELPLAVAAVMIPTVTSYIDVFLRHEQQASAHLDDVANSSSAVFWEVDTETGAFTRVSGQIREVFGYAPADLPEALPELLVEEDRNKWWEQVRDEEGDQFILECRSVGFGGHTIWLRLHVRRVALGNHFSVLRGIAFDVTELAESNDEVRRRAETDHLTGLANRFALVDGLKERLAAGQSFALVVMDLDRFKEINDTLGHQSGDVYLQIVASRLEVRVGDRGMIARMGGDEFAVVLDAVGMDSAIAQAQSLADICAMPVELEGLELSGSASCGIAAAPIHGTTAEDLLRRADLAMYAAKRSGSGVHVFEFSADESDLDRLQLSGEVEEAFGAGQMRLWFQPKVDLATGQITGAEGLMRWHHPERGVLMPKHFIEIIEVSKHRRSLRTLVLKQGIECLAATRDIKPAVSIAINISIRDLVEPGFVDLVAQQLDDEGIARERLTLEITERDLMDDRTGFRQAAVAVNATGVRLSIDDFGTGHSSLLRLHQLPVDELKIDRSFVTQLGLEPQADIIVRSIIELANSLGYQVVAEGIERFNEVETLVNLGCRTGQGFLYSSALPRNEFVDLLQSMPVYGAFSAISENGLAQPR